MDEIKRDEYSWGVVLTTRWVNGAVRLKSGISQKPTQLLVSCAALVGASPAEARAFAQRIIAVADAVEAELSKGGK